MTSERQDSQSMGPCKGLLVRGSDLIKENAPRNSVGLDSYLSTVSASDGTYNSLIKKCAKH
jgi:hypothetical protein